MGAKVGRFGIAFHTQIDVTICMLVSSALALMGAQEEQRCRTGKGWIPPTVTGCRATFCGRGSSSGSRAASGSSDRRRIARTRGAAKRPCRTATWPTSGTSAKYGLLRALCAEEPTWGTRTYDLSLGVVWYLVPDEEGTADGGHVGWTNQATSTIRRYMPCDPELYHALLRMLRDGDRSVRAVRERRVLPEGTVFYEEVLSFAGMPSVGRVAKERRLERREAWAWDALAATRGCDVVFPDPDNGLEPRAGVPRHRLTGPKYAYFDELAPYLDRGQSLVVYHHLHRSLAHESQVRDRLSQLEERLGPAFALRFGPGTGRASFERGEPRGVHDHGVELGDQSGREGLAETDPNHRSDG